MLARKDNPERMLAELRAFALEFEARKARIDAMLCACEESFSAILAICVARLAIVEEGEKTVRNIKVFRPTTTEKEEK